ncbi:MAG: methyltransferase domain-containing protein [Chloroflexota bacterium]
MKVDFGKTAGDYKQHRQGFPPRFFERLAAMELIGTGKTVLDVGTGTGTLARGIAQAGSDVTGVDIAAPMMEQAKVLDNEAGITIAYHIAPAENIPLPDATFDTVTAGQCWHWFDRPRAANEVKRLLKPGGAVVIAHLDWIPLPGNLVAATETLMLQHNPAWAMSGGTGIYPAWLADLASAGFADIETFSFDVDLMYTPEAWRGRIRASAGIAASLEPEAVQRFDAEFKTLLETQFPGEMLPILHRVWAVTARKP